MLREIIQSIITSIATIGSRLTRQSAFERWWTASFLDNPTRGIPSMQEKNIVSIHRALRMPFKLIPDVKRFTVELNGLNWLFELFGVKAKYPPQLVFSPFVNRRINRYVIYQFLRLAKIRDGKYGFGRADLYWKVGWQLMKSKSFQVMALRRTVPRWHRELPYCSVRAIMKRVDSMVAKRATSLEFKRVYIPKPDSYDERPLGVPTIEWRIYLGMVNDLVSWAIRPKISESQHGFQTKRGTLTAWREIVSSVIPSADIYEYDLKKFFDSVKIDYILEMLYKWKSVDIPTARFLKRILSSLPKLSDEDIMAGGRRAFSEDYVIRRRSFLESQPEYDDKLSFREAATDKERRLVAQMKKEQGVEPYFLVNRGPSSSPLGTPQGAPISPTLSLVALEETMFGKKKLIAKYQKEFNNIPRNIMYADDGLRYGDRLPDPPLNGNLGENDAFFENFRSAGISVHEGKSGWVKKDGQWLKPLRFLGIEYNGITGVFRGKTRKGSTLEFTEDKAFLAHLDKLAGDDYFGRVPKIEEFFETGWAKFLGPSYEHMFKSRFLGLFFARLYYGSWNQVMSQDFSLTNRPGSWVDLKAVKFMRNEHLDEILTVFNSSSFACHSLLQDLKLGARHKRRVAYLASLAFGTRAALVKIRRIWSGPGKKGVS